MKQYRAQKNKLSVHIQGVREEFERFLLDGYNIYDEEDRQLIARAGCPADLDGFNFEEMVQTIKTGG